MKKYKTAKSSALKPTNQLHKKALTQLYAWLLGKWEYNKGWIPNDDLWLQCPYVKIGIARTEFEELIRQMKEEEGWK